MERTRLQAINEEVAKRNFLTEARNRLRLTEDQIKIHSVNNMGQANQSTFWYEVIYEMVCADVGFTSSVAATPIGNVDSYAPGDARIPKMLGRRKKSRFVQRRKFPKGM
jgi:hypothetical protein